MEIMNDNKKKSNRWTNCEVKLILQELKEEHNNKKSKKSSSPTDWLTNLQQKFVGIGSLRSRSAIEGRYKSVKHNINLTKKARSFFSSLPSSTFELSSLNYSTTNLPLPPPLLPEVQPPPLPEAPPPLLEVLPPPPPLLPEVQPPPLPEVQSSSLAKDTIMHLLEDLKEIGMSNLSTNLKEELYLNKHKNLGSLLSNL
jgi:hypothetical protein